MTRGGTRRGFRGHPDSESALNGLESLRDEVRDLKRRLDGIESRYLSVKRGEERWHPSLRERDRLLFMNGTRVTSLGFRASWPG